MKIKSPALLLVILLLPLINYGQSILPTSYAEYSGNDYFIAGNKITNNNNKTVTYRWVRTILNLPTGWQTSICDPSYCHSATKDSFDITMPSGKTGQLDCNFYLGLAPELGTAQVELKIFPIDNRKEVTKIIYTGKLLSLNSIETTHFFDEHIIAYYNIEFSTIKLKLVGNNQINLITLKNVFGNVIYSAEEIGSTDVTINTNLFAKGIYFITATTNSGIEMRKKVLVN